MNWFLYDNGLRHERVNLGCFRGLRKTKQNEIKNKKNTKVKNNKEKKNGMKEKRRKFRLTHAHNFACSKIKVGYPFCLAHFISI